VTKINDYNRKGFKRAHPDLRDDCSTMFNNTLSQISSSWSDALDGAHPIPVVDIFAGPGGLAEGFSRFRKNGIQVFKIVLSIEKDIVAHKTLLLRAFYRQFTPGCVPSAYYRYLAGQITRTELFNGYPTEAKRADLEAWNATLGVTDSKEVDSKITAAIGSAKCWVLIGGPPCQAYSMVGRARVGGIKDGDQRAYLYQEYLRILTKHRPTMFVMENVKGILSAQINSESVFDKILKDLGRPDESTKLRASDPNNYKIYSFTSNEPKKDNTSQKMDFVIRCERYGLPQARHRVILFGIRSDCDSGNPAKLTSTPPISSASVLMGMPRLRSGITKCPDSYDAWLKCLVSVKSSLWIKDTKVSPKLRKRLLRYISILSAPKNNRGNEVIDAAATIGSLSHWYIDPKLNVIINHSSRAHLPNDLHRYFFASSFAKVTKATPFLSDFPVLLWPLHKNVVKALDGTHFPDRFRVVVGSKPSTTITSHIGKDGHYYIHPDPTQARSLTVREAARLQTFSDNYLFEGNRTEQYVQVGNAVPPLLALQLAECVAKTFDSIVSISTTSLSGDANHVSVTRLVGVTK
jgi:DNA (cytosine-5)-methyltransferase 1